MPLVPALSNPSRSIRVPSGVLSTIFIAAAMPMGQVQAQDSTSEEQELIGRIHNATRAARKRQELSLAEEFDLAHLRYAKALKEIEDATGVFFSMEASSMSQWGTPNGGYGAVQAMFTPGIDWYMFSVPGVGKGSMEFNFLAAQYWSGATGTSLGSTLGLLSPINNQPTANQQFVQLTYTHRFPGNWLAITLGQYPFSNFDANAYNDQQVNFIGYSLTQNGSQNYSQSGLGAYAQINPTKQITFAAGVQDANDLSGSYIQFSTWAKAIRLVRLRRMVTDRRPVGQGYLFAPVLQSARRIVATRRQRGSVLQRLSTIGNKGGLFLRATRLGGPASRSSRRLRAAAFTTIRFGAALYDQIGLGMAWNATNMSVFQGPSCGRARHAGTVLDVVGFQDHPDHAQRPAVPAARLVTLGSPLRQYSRFA